MSSRTSFFNFTIFKCDLKRFWWISALSCIIMFLCGTLPFYDMSKYYLQNQSLNYSAESVLHRTISYFENTIFNMSMVMGIITGVALGAFLFTYMNKVNAVSCIHGLPVTRKQLYFTHLLSGLALLIVPFIINALLWINPLLSCGANLLCVLKALYIYLIIGILSLTIVTCIGMLTGNTAAQVIFSGIIVLLPLFFSFFIIFVSEACVYGFNDCTTAVLEALMEYVYIGPALLITARSLIYITFILIFSFAGLIIYKLRHLENHGEVIAFPKLKGIFTVLVALCSGILGYFYSIAMWEITNLLIMIPFSLIGLIIAHMLAHKSFSLKGILKPLIAAILIDIAIFSLVEFDLTGFEKRVPELDNVVNVEFTDSYYRTDFYDEQGNRYNFAEVFRPVYTNDDEIQMFIDMHKHMVEDRVNDNQPYNNSRNVAFAYTLKNGTKMYREYRLLEDDVEKYLAPIHETSTYRAYQYPILDGTAKLYDVAYIRHRRDVSKEDIMYKADSESFNKLIEAIKKDRKDISYEEMNYRRNNDASIRIDISYRKQGVDKYGNLIEKYGTFTDTYNITNDDVNTLDVLTEIGYYDIANIKTTSEGLTQVNVLVHNVLQDGEDISYGTIQEETIEVILNNNVTYDDFHPDTNIAVKATAAYYKGDRVPIEYTDKNQCEELFSLAFDAPHVDDPYSLNGIYVNLYMEFIYGEGSYNCEFWVRGDMLPEFLLKDSSK